MKLVPVKMRNGEKKFLQSNTILPVTRMNKMKIPTQLNSNEHT